MSLVCDCRLARMRAGQGAFVLLRNFRRVLAAQASHGNWKWLQRPSLILPVALGNGESFAINRPRLSTSAGFVRPVRVDIALRIFRIPYSFSLKNPTVYTDILIIRHIFFDVHIATKHALHLCWVSWYLRCLCN